MEYIGDFPPCIHRFINSNGVILCQNCGVISRANDSLSTRITRGQTLLR